MGNLFDTIHIVINTNINNGISINKNHECIKHLRERNNLQQSPNMDLTKIINKNEDKDLKDLKKSLEKYMKSRGMNIKDTKDQVDLSLVIFCLFDIEEDIFEEYISRLNLLQLKRMGLMDDKNKRTIH